MPGQRLTGGNEQYVEAEADNMLCRIKYAFGIVNIGGAGCDVGGVGGTVGGFVVSLLVSLLVVLLVMLLVEL